MENKQSLQTFFVDKILWRIYDPTTPSNGGFNFLATFLSLPLLMCCLLLCLSFGAVGSSAYADTKYSKASDFPGKGDYKAWLKANVVFNEGNAFKKEGAFDQAIAKYQQAISIYPFDAEYFNNLGSAYKGKSDYTNAAASYRKALSIREIWQSWANLGSVLAKTGSGRESKAAYQHALNLSPPVSVRESIQADMAKVDAKPYAGAR